MSKPEPKDESKLDLRDESQPKRTHMSQQERNARPQRKQTSGPERERNSRPDHKNESGEARRREGTKARNQYNNNRIIEAWSKSVPSRNGASLLNVGKQIKRDTTHEREYPAEANSPQYHTEQQRGPSRRLPPDDEARDLTRTPTESLPRGPLVPAGSSSQAPAPNPAPNPAPEAPRFSTSAGVNQRQQMSAGATRPTPSSTARAARNQRAVNTQRPFSPVPMALIPGPQSSQTLSASRPSCALGQSSRQASSTNLRLEAQANANVPQHGTQAVASRTATTTAAPLRSSQSSQPHPLRRQNRHPELRQAPIQTDRDCGSVSMHHPTGSGNDRDGLSSQPYPSSVNLTNIQALVDLDRHGFSSDPATAFYFLTAEPTSQRAPSRRENSES
ncbi:hypothetical protein BDW74DRAFT_31233 [Aspergillus multicolor]|uniref:uncharacterized protein n=1 Tax=Aspergillus multicolor TaxID=41759 RepID=UPI003CCCD4D2